MNKNVIWTMAACAVLGGGGCASNRPKTAVEGQAVFGALQQAAATAGRKVEPSLAFVKVERNTVPQRSVGGGVTIVTGNRSGPSSFGGLTLTPEGHLLVPSVIKRDQDDRITVLIGENEYVADPVKTDETLGMTILKLDADETFTPLDISQGADLEVGEWAIVLKPTDEDSDYQKLSLLVVCQGEQVGRHRRFLVNQSLASFTGALVVNLSGRVVGVVDRNTVLAINDLRDDLRRLVADATDPNSSDDDNEKKGWFGALLQPVNKEYAKARDLSPSSLLVLHASQDGPAAAAGVRDGDLIVALNGKPLRLSGSRALEYFLQSLHPRAGDPFAVTVLRDGKRLDFSGAFTKAPEPATLRAEDLGVTVNSITDTEVYAQNLATDEGVLVTDVQRGSPAANSGTLRRTLISKSDIIVELAGQPTPTIEAFGQALEAIRRDHPPVVLVKYYRGPITGYAGLNLALGEKDNRTKP